VNGVKTADPSSSQSNEAVNQASPKPEHIKEPSEIETTATLTASDPDLTGSSDAALKAAANDPATHEVNGDANGIPAPPVTGEASTAVSKSSPKRKEVPGAEEPAAKKPRTENEVATAPRVECEESEEGELEE
jgi:hypothetical protein